MKSLILINKDTLDFFSEIEHNNNKPWFLAQGKRLVEAQQMTIGAMEGAVSLQSAVINYGKAL
jgi:uncharacterized protein (DUF2461 family)